MMFIDNILQLYTLLTVSKSSYQTILNVLIPFLFILISNYWRQVYDYLYYIGQRRTKHTLIELTGTITEDRHEITAKFSEKLKALVFYINEHCLDDVRLKKLIEISFNNYSVYNNSSSLDFETEYLIDQDIPLKLADDIMCRVQIKNNHNLHEKNNTKTKDVCIQIYSDKLTIRQLQSFMQLAEEYYKNFVETKMHNCIYCFLYLKDDNDGMPIFNMNEFSSTKTFENLIFKNKDVLKERLDFFLNNKDFYNKLGIPYTLGMLLYGDPGCGKTSTIKAIANYAKRHLIVIPMNKVYTLTSLRQIILSEEIAGFKIPHNKRLYVFEEIDCNGMEKLIAKRSNKISVQQSDTTLIKQIISEYSKHTNYSKQQEPEAKNQNDDKITLGSLLELLDGINEAAGRILIMTTNNIPSFFDEALLRPGRIDIKMKFTKCNQDEISQFYTMWFNEDIPINILKNVKENIFSPAELGEIFINNLSNPQEILKILTR